MTTESDHALKILCIDQTSSIYIVCNIWPFSTDTSMCSTYRLLGNFEGELHVDESTNTRSWMLSVLFTPLTRLPQQ